MTSQGSRGDREERLAFLADTVDLLWPGLDGGGPAASMTVVPSTRTPRLLVPMRPRRAAAAAVRRYTAQQGRRERLAGTALAAGLLAGWRSRGGPVVSRAPHGETIADHLAGVLGRRVVTALAITHERPNRKPVLQVFDERGATVAFAKIGVSPLAAQLVDAEAAALAILADAALPHVEVPAVLGHDRWGHLPVLVTTPLPLRPAPEPDDPVLLAATQEISALAHADIDGYLAAMRRRADALGAKADQWLDMLDEVAGARELSAVPVGAWHGDFTEWNCARNDGRLMVWDWERFADPAPVGFDRLHFLLNRQVRARRDLFRSAAAGLLTDAPTLLRAWRLDAEVARTVAMLYLLDISLRYLTDDLRSSDPGGNVERWAYPVIRHQLAADRCR